jgi:type I restriction enzyme S subunit
VTAVLGSLCQFVNGGTPAKSEARFFDGDIPWITSADITGPVVTSARSFITNEAIAASATNKVHAGTVLLVTRTGVGKVAVAGRDLCFSQDITALVLDRTRIDHSYLVHFLRTKQDYFLSMARGATIKGITREVVAGLELPTPPLPEQRRIAAILDKADALRTQRREALTQLRRLSQSVFVQMFGEPGRNTKNWPVRALKELGKISTGGTPPSAMDGMFGGSIPFITPGDLDNERPVRRMVTEAGAREAGTVRAGATLVCCIGATIGKMGIAPARSSFNQQLNAVEWNSNVVDDSYGAVVLRFFKPTIVAWGASTTLPILKKSSFEKIEIPVPPLSMQHEFASRLKSVQQVETGARHSSVECEHLFSSLQYAAFRGGL